MGWGRSGEPGVAAVVLGWKLFQLLVLFHPAIYDLGAKRYLIPGYI